MSLAIITVNEINYKWNFTCFGNKNTNISIYYIILYYFCILCYTVMYSHLGLTYFHEFLNLQKILIQFREFIFNCLYKFYIDTIKENKKKKKE